MSNIVYNDLIMFHRINNRKWPDLSPAQQYVLRENYKRANPGYTNDMATGAIKKSLKKEFMGGGDNFIAKICKFDSKNRIVFNIKERMRRKFAI